jgi:hypothetical protein
MLDRIQPGTARRIVRLIKPTAIPLWIALPLLQSSVGCQPPESLQPLLSLIDSFTTLAFLAGISLGVLGFSISGVMYMLPGEDWTRTGKKLGRHAFVGVVILLAAPMIVDYLVASLGGDAFCTDSGGE